MHPRIAPYASVVLLGLRLIVISLSHRTTQSSCRSKMHPPHCKENSFSRHDLQMHCHTTQTTQTVTILARPGEAITFFTEEDSGLLKPIANQIKAAGGEVPEWMLHLKRRKWLPPAERGHSFNKDNKDGEADAKPAASGAPSTKQQRQQNRGKLGKKGAGKDKQDASDGEKSGRVAVVGKEKEGAAGGAVKARPAKSHGGISTIPRFDVQQRRKKQEMVEASKRKKAKGL